MHSTWVRIYQSQWTSMSSAYAYNLAVHQIQLAQMQPCYSPQTLKINEYLANTFSYSRKRQSITDTLSREPIRTISSLHSKLKVYIYTHNHSHSDILTALIQKIGFKDTSKSLKRAQMTKRIGPIILYRNNPSIVMWCVLIGMEKYKCSIRNKHQALSGKECGIGITFPKAICLRCRISTRS